MCSVGYLNNNMRGDCFRIFSDSQNENRITMYDVYIHCLVSSLLFSYLQNEFEIAAIF